MVVMLLDHTRDFVHREGMSGDPTDPATTTAALFFTRWITHYCAPTFVLLAGLSARLQLQRGMSRAELTSYLWQRGLFLVALEVVVLRPLIWFHLDYSLLAHLQVIWAIGCSMCGLAFLLRLPVAAIGALGLVIVAGHNLLGHEPVAFVAFPSWHGLWVLLHVKAGLQVGGQSGPVAFVQYPLLPWFGVMLCGYWLGTLYALPTAARRRWLLRLGVIATITFVGLRAFGCHGDPFPWEHQPTLVKNVFAFLRLEKYPPSLQFLLMTIGPALVALALFERVRGDGAMRALVALGRVPLFFYILQWPAVHLVSRLFQWLDGQPMGWDAPLPSTLGEELPRLCGFSLPVVYLAYAVCLAVLVPLSIVFARWKQRHPQLAWLRYL